MGVVLAGPIVNIVFGLVVYFILISIIYNVEIAGNATMRFIGTFLDSIKTLISGGASMDDLAGPVGIATIVSQTSGLADFIYLLSVISLSLGLTNLLPIPPLDGGKVVIYIIEAIRRKPMKEKTEVTIQMLGFAILIGLSIFVTYNDILRIF